MKKIIVSFIIISLAMLVGCTAAATPKEFSASGITLTLTDDFAEENFEGFTACFQSSHSIVFTLKESFDIFEGSELWTLDEYAQAVLDANNKDSVISTNDGLTSFVFDYENEGILYKYYCSVYKSADAFWLVQFSCVADEYDEHKDDFVTWAKSVKV